MLRSISIAQRLYGGFGAVLVLAAAIAVISILTGTAIRSIFETYEATAEE